ncbi:hypothetical protein ACA910_009716 [Epithemia clementina (nom. ined.)]
MSPPPSIPSSASYPIIMINNHHPANHPAWTWTAEAVASLPPPGLSGPSQVMFSPSPPSTVSAEEEKVQPSLHSNDHDTNTKDDDDDDDDNDRRLYLAFVSSPCTLIRTAKIPTSVFSPLTTGLYPTTTLNTNTNHTNTSNANPTTNHTSFSAHSNFPMIGMQPQPQPLSYNGVPRPPFGLAAPPTSLSLSSSSSYRQPLSSSQQPPPMSQPTSGPSSLAFWGGPVSSSSWQSPTQSPPPPLQPSMAASSTNTTNHHAERMLLYLDLTNQRSTTTPTKSTATTTANPHSPRRRPPQGDQDDVDEDHHKTKNVDDHEPSSSSLTSSPPSSSPQRRKMRMLAPPYPLLRIMRPSPPPPPQRPPQHSIPPPQSASSAKQPPPPQSAPAKNHANKRRLLESALSSSASSSLLSSSFGYTNNNSAAVAATDPVAPPPSAWSAAAAAATVLPWGSPPVTQFSWTWCRGETKSGAFLRLLIPWRGSLFVQDGVLPQPAPIIGSTNAPQPPRCLYNAAAASHIGPCDNAQLSPDGTMVAWCALGEVYVQAVTAAAADSNSPAPVPITFGAVTSSSSLSSSSTSNGGTGGCCITHGLAEFVAQEEMDRYRGFWWHPQSLGILLTRVDESSIPPYRILHHHHHQQQQPMTTTTTTTTTTTSGEFLTNPQQQAHSQPQPTTAASQPPQSSSQLPPPSSTTPPLSIPYEDHRYPFAGKVNATVELAFVQVDRASILSSVRPTTTTTTSSTSQDHSQPVSNKRGDAMVVEEEGDQEYEHDNDDDGRDPPPPSETPASSSSSSPLLSAQERARQNWTECSWLEAPREACEYLARIYWLPDGSAAVAQWQNRAQNVSIWTRMEIPKNHKQDHHHHHHHPEDHQQAPPPNPRRSSSKKGMEILLVEQSDHWINLHDMFHVLPRAIHPDECIPTPTTPSAAAATAADNKKKPLQQQQQQGQLQAIPSLPNPLPEGSFSFLFASERTGYQHLYLYTYCPGITLPIIIPQQQSTNNITLTPQSPPLPPHQSAIPLRAISMGPWMVESIAGVDMAKDVVYVTGTYDSVLERHLYALPLLNRRLVTTANHNHATAATTFTTTLPLSTTTAPTTTTELLSDHSSSSSSGNNNGVRRGLSKVMHVLSGKSRSSSNNNNNKNTNHHHNNNHTSLYSHGVIQKAMADSARPVRITLESGMHNIVMDDGCQFFVDSSSDVDRPNSCRLYEIVWGKSRDGVGGTTTTTATAQQQPQQPTSPWSLRLVYTLFDAMHEDQSLSSASSVAMALSTTTGTTNVGAAGTSTQCPSPFDGLPSSGGARLLASLPPPELISFPCSDGTETLHAAVYRPNPHIYGPGPYPLICAVYGGPHVQRVHRSWSQCADMRAQRLRSMGFCVVKCDNRGSSRRGTAFETSIRRRLGRNEVLDQVAAVRELTLRGWVDTSRIGVYGWSYGGYLAAMCLCRAPDVFTCAVAGAPVSSWDGYDTHYTERYMGQMHDNLVGYRESAVLDHVPNMRGPILLIHGLLDENVHFRHSARLIQKLVACGKEYELLLFPEERHSPRRLRDRIYMEQRIADFFLKRMGGTNSSSSFVTTTQPPTAQLQQFQQQQQQYYAGGGGGTTFGRTGVPLSSQPAPPQQQQLPSSPHPPSDLMAALAPPGGHNNNKKNHNHHGMRTLGHL